jgi:antibiotic biosynthesis monooxygenase (ABM) superfamily enzyme
MLFPPAMPVTTFIRVTPVEGKEKELLAWFEQMAVRASMFQGYQRSETFQALEPGGQPQWLNVFTFDSFDNVQKWLSSEERTESLASGAYLFGQTIQRQQMAGIEFWFEDKDRQKAPAPPRWKMAIISGIAILVLLHTAICWFAILLVRLNLPPWLISVLSVMAMIILMTYVIMPALSRVLRRWHLL